MIENIDNYLSKNKKQFFAMMNSHWGKNDDDTKKLKFLWNKAQEASGVNDKIQAFEELKKAMKPFIHEERLAKNEKILEENNIDKFAYPEDQLTLEMDRMFSALSNFPEVNRLEDLNIDDAWSQGYDYEQMKELAKQYGYDYRNKDDRVEFLNKLGEYHKQKNVEKAFTVDPNAPLLDKAAHVITDFTLPVSEEYAKRNYENINGIDDIKYPLMADAATNVAMFGVPGKAVTNPTVKMAVNNITAPAIREGAQMALNKKSAKDAAIDAFGAVATNYATPWGIQRGYNWANRMVQNESKLAAKDMINQTASRVRNIERQLNEGKVFRRSNHDGSFTYAKKNSKGNIINISNEEAAKANGVLPLEDYEFYLNHKNIARSTRKQNEFVNEDVWKLGGKEKFEYNLQEGRPRFEKMSPYEIADAAGVKPKETIFNWLKESEPANRVGDYVTNFQGQTRFATPMLNTLTRTLGPLGELVQIEKDPSLSKKDKEELNLYKRLYELHMAHKDLFPEPKLPEKFKDYMKKTSINEIFGE